jgi:hypothetical protein
MRHRARRDTIESDIRDALERMRLPYRIVSCPALGDMEVIVDGTPHLLEVKTGNAPYTQAQKARREWLAGHGVSLHKYAPTVRSVQDLEQWVMGLRT